MKRFYIAAATLMLGTSTLALAQTGKDEVDLTGSKTTVGKTAFTDKAAELKTDFADKKTVDMAWADSDQAKLQSAAWVDGSDKPALGTEPEAKLQVAAVDESWKKVQASVDHDAKIEMASFDKVDGGEVGMGGPLEEVDTAGLKPQPATKSYPACSPGPGDDNCIQLYERGVREQLAGWKSSGGLADGSATTAMGGPFEPIGTEAEAGAAARAGDGLVSLASGETEDVGFAGAAVAAHTEFGGVGGPIEAQSGYPPCSPGPGDDRCIQLYEAGVTGAGN